jgi:exopolysaccharide biosynthesis polyprenyl glycosylphosphotransferase
MVLADTLCVVAAYLSIWTLRPAAWWTGDHPLAVLGDAAVFLTVPLWIVVFALGGLYDRRELTAGSEEVRRIFSAVTTSVIVIVMLVFWLGVDVSRSWAAGVFATGLLSLLVGRTFVRQAIRRLNERGRLVTPALVIGTNGEARRIARSLARNKWLSYDLIGFVGVGDDDVEATVEGKPVLGQVEAIDEIVRSTGAAAVIIAGTAVDPTRLTMIDRVLQPLKLEVRLSPGLPQVSPSRITVRPLDGLALLSLDRRELGRWPSVLKRTVDIIGALVLLIVSAPLMAVVAVLVKLTSPGPVLFRQRRVGKDGRHFHMWKFRTMCVNAEDEVVSLVDENIADGLLFKMTDDPRVTRIGRTLRRWALDELPQAYNVLAGHMSLVGPRPALPRETDRYDDDLRTRLRVKPGLTGLWQVNGRHQLPFDDYIRYDLFYVENWSLGLDLYVIAKTIPAVLGRRGSL